MYKTFYIDAAFILLYVHAAENNIISLIWYIERSKQIFLTPTSPVRLSSNSSATVWFKSVKID